MKYKRIHACPNDCILYRKEFEGLKKCLKCGLSQYKQKINSEDKGGLEIDGPTLKVVWYLPIVPRLKRLFGNPKDAKILEGMQMKEDVTICFVIQLIQCNGKILIMSSSNSVKNVEIFALV